MEEAGCTRRDPKNSKIPDFATDFAKTIYPYYKFRILSAKQFIP